jgi:hypothetical protein
MSDIAAIAFNWVFSAASLVHLAGLAVLTAAAIWLSTNRQTPRFLLVALAVWLVASAISAVGSSSVRAAMAGVLWCLSIVTIYALGLGFLVSRAKTPRTVVAASLVLLLVQLPFSLLSGIYFACYVGHDCP